MSKSISLKFSIKKNESICPLDGSKFNLLNSTSAKGLERKSLRALVRWSWNVDKDHDLQKALLSQINLIDQIVVTDYLYWLVT